MGSNRGCVENVFLQVQKGRLKRTTGSWTALRDAPAGVLVIYRVVKQNILPNTQLISVLHLMSEVNGSE